jgi:hypothetical protein
MRFIYLSFFFFFFFEGILKNIHYFKEKDPRRSHKNERFISPYNINNTWWDIPQPSRHSDMGGSQLCKRMSRNIGIPQYMNKTGIIQLL